MVTTIFVNRLQFGHGEDFEKYPRTFAEDCDEAEARMAFTSCSIRTRRRCTRSRRCSWSTRPPIANKLEGRFRPGHFRGVATVVLKLFNTVQPQVAVFGKKDYQQLHDRAAHGRTSWRCRSKSSRPRPCAPTTGWRCLRATASCRPTQRREAPRLHQVLDQVK